MAHAAAEMSVADKEKRFLSLYIANEAERYVTNISNSFIFPKITNIGTPIFSINLVDVFVKDKEVVNKKYQNLRMIINGQLSSDSSLKKGTNELFLEEDNDAKFTIYIDADKKLLDQLPDLHSSERSLLNCNGGTLKGATFVLKNCFLLPSSMKNQDALGTEIASKFLSGYDISGMIKEPDGNPISVFLFMLKYASQNLDQNSPCLSKAEFEDCRLNEIMNVSFVTTPEFKATYEASQKRYHLPDYASQFKH